MTEVNDLKLVSTDDLFSEISKRFKGTVMVAVAEPITGEESPPMLWFDGGRFQAIGLAQYAASFLVAAGPCAFHNHEDDAEGG